MSDQPGMPAGLLPETRQLIETRAATIDRVRMGIGQVLTAVDPPLEDAVSGLATVLVMLVQCVDGENYPRVSEAIRGLSKALGAYAGAADHASGCAAMAAAADTHNRAVFERMDVDVATTTAKRN